MKILEIIIDNYFFSIGPMDEKKKIFDLHQP